MSVNLYNATTDTLKNIAGDIINPKSVNEMIAPIEDGTASKAYAVGEQFIMNDLLCEATQAIAQGDTIVIGTNCEESEQLSKQVKDINTSLTANGNRFEAGYLSANDEYGFNIGSTFYPIGASSGGGSGVVPLLDFDNAVDLTDTTTAINYTTPEDGVLLGRPFAKTNEGTLFIDGVKASHLGSATGHGAYTMPVIYGVKKGSVITTSAPLYNASSVFLTFVPYLYQSVEPVITVYNEAEVTLDYGNPLHTFSAGNLSYTATKDCWLIGTIKSTSQSGAHLQINNTEIANGWIQSQTDLEYIIPIYKLSRGDIVSVATPQDKLHVLEGTVSGSVGAFKREVQRSYYFGLKYGAPVDIDISSLKDTEEITITVSYAAGNSFNSERVSVSTAKTYNAHILEAQANIGTSITYVNGKLQFVASHTSYSVVVWVTFN